MICKWVMKKMRRWARQRLLRTTPLYVGECAECFNYSLLRTGVCDICGYRTVARGLRND